MNDNNRTNGLQHHKDGKIPEYKMSETHRPVRQYNLTILILFTQEKIIADNFEEQR